MPTQTNMNANEYACIEQLLKDRIGLDPAALGSKGVATAAAERMRQLKINELSAYIALLAGSLQELEALIELVVIPETWFFRDREPFIFLADFIRSEWKNIHSAEILRILSAPCATGEEPYSIVMTCLDCGLQKNQFAVDAIDINASFLRKARHAVYGRNSFRGADPAFRDRYFTRNGQDYALKPLVRDCVRFSKANILEPEHFPGFAPYHVVFCRNLLIYLHDQARVRTMAAVDRLLLNGGFLFIGHAEANPWLMEKYIVTEHHGAFAYRKPAKNQLESGLRRQQLYPFPTGRANPPWPAEAPERRGQGEPIFRRLGRDASPYLLHKTETHMRKPDPPVEAKSNINLEHATRLANAGRLAEATEACTHLLQTDKGNAQAHFLMGIIKEARGDSRAAEDYLNRAIYLDADFADAILHLAVLKEQSGDSAAAEILRRRAGAINAAGEKQK